MTNTDSGPFMDLIPAISLRENERGAQVGGGWDPHWHQVTDVYATFSDKDFRLGPNSGVESVHPERSHFGSRRLGPIRRARCGDRRG